VAAHDSASRASLPASARGDAEALGEKLSIRPGKDGSYSLRVGFG
jgi:hypothetical protein